jgi:transcriptional regulator with XRE-family HTH domain
MNDTVNQRIKKLRKALKLTQNEFSSVITISSGQLACIETEKRVVNDRTIKLICDSFKINSEWLKTGKGEIYIEDKDLRNTKLLALFDTLKPQFQEYIVTSINYFIKMQQGQ